jgi:hypothetical protein
MFDFTSISNKASDAHRSSEVHLPLQSLVLYGKKRGKAILKG